MVAAAARRSSNLSEIGPTGAGNQSRLPNAQDQGVKLYAKSRKASKALWPAGMGTKAVAA